MSEDEVTVEFEFSVHKLSDGNYRIAAPEGGAISQNQVYEALSIALRDLNAQATALTVQQAMFHAAMAAQQDQGLGKRTEGGVVLPNG